MHSVHLIRRNKQFVAVTVAKLDIVTGFSVNRQCADARESAYSVRFMHDEIADAEIVQRQSVMRVLCRFCLRTIFRTEKLIFRNDRKPKLRILKPARNRLPGDNYFAFNDVPAEFLSYGSFYSQIGKNIMQPFRMSAGIKQNGEAFLPPKADVVAQSRIPLHVARNLP